MVLKEEKSTENRKSKILFSKFFFKHMNEMHRNMNEILFFFFPRFIIIKHHYVNQ